jgi:hypothetical protein
MMMLTVIMTFIFLVFGSVAAAVPSRKYLFTYTVNEHTTALFQAVRSNDSQEAFKLLCSCKMDIYPLCLVDHAGYTLLILAARYASSEMVENIIASCHKHGTGRTYLPGQSRANAQLNNTASDEEGNSLEGWTALHFAVKRGQLAIVVALLAEGADPRIQASSGHSALDLAKIKGFKELEIILLGQIARIEASEHSRPRRRCFGFCIF